MSYAICHVTSLKLETCKLEVDIAASSSITAFCTKWISEGRHGLNQTDTIIGCVTKEILLL